MACVQSVNRNLNRKIIRSNRNIFIFNHNFSCVNCSPIIQVKGIITRAGMGTKIILLGDPQQIDHPLLDERTNGLSYAAEKMKGSPLCWQVTMSAEECERSALAMDAVKRM